MSILKQLFTASSLALLPVSALVAQALAPIVYETEQEWWIDLPRVSSEGDLQLTIVDKATGSLRTYVASELPGKTILKPNWQTASELVPLPVEALSVIGEGESSEFVIPYPFENHVQFFELSGASSRANLYPAGIGPERVISFPPVSSQNQSEPMLLVQSGFNNAPNQTQQHVFASTNAGGPFDDQISVVAEPFERSLTFPRDATEALDGANAMVAMVFEKKLMLGKPQQDGLNIWKSRDVVADGRLLYGDFLQLSKETQVLVFAPGHSKLYLYKLDKPFFGSWQFEEPIVYERGVPIQMVTRLIIDGQDYVAILYAGNRQFEIFDLANDLAINTGTIDGDVGSIHGLVSVNGDRLLALGGSSSETSTYELFTYNSGAGQLESLYQGKLSGVLTEESPRGRPHAFYFDQSPLSSSSASLIGWNSAGNGVDWASHGSISAQNVDFKAWIDTGADSGLQYAYNSNFALPASANTALVNQINETASVVGEGIYGDEDLALFASWSPRPGAHNTLAKIEANYPVGTSLHYRTAANRPWQLYSAPFFPEQAELTISYFIETHSGRKSPIQTVQYVFSAQAMNRDSNGDGIPDYVQAGLGLDPFGSGDSDGDSSSDADELLMGTSPTDPNDFLDESDERLNRTDVATLRLTSENHNDQSWRSGSLAYVDRPSGARLGQAVAKLDKGSQVASFAKISILYPEAVLALSTEERFFCEGDNDIPVVPSGFEQLRLFPIGSREDIEIDLPYNGGQLATSAGLWVDAFLASYGSNPARSFDVLLGIEDTAYALAMEFAWETELKARGLLASDAQLTLFPNRKGDARLQSLAEIVESTELSLGELSAGLHLEATYTNTLQTAEAWTKWPDYCRDIYSEYVALQPAAITGRGPVDILRALLRGQGLPADLVEDLNLELKATQQAIAEAGSLRASFVSDEVEAYTLTVVDSNSDGCFLVSDALTQDFSLYDANGERYIASKAVEIFSGTQVRVEAVLRSDWSACAGQALEVRSFHVLELPALVKQDVDGNLLEDGWELFWLPPGSYDPFEQIDGSGYTLLQQYLTGNAPSELPDEAIEDLSPPAMDIQFTGENQITLTWDWPGAYSDLIQFKLVEADELGSFSSIEPVSVDSSRTGDAHTLILTVPSNSERRFYKLVMSL